MIGDHVAQGAGLVKVAGAILYADGFGDRDLHMVNIILVPDRLKDAIAEAEDQNILYGLLAQIVVDAKNLIFCEHFGKMLVQGFGRFQVIAEGLFKDESTPLARSEEHTSELQSLAYLVCRLL